MTRLLLVNGNTSNTVTQKLLAEAERYAGANVQISAVTARFGADLVSNRASNVIAGHAVLDAVAHHQDPYDAVLVAISLDTAVEALREVLSVPVVGMTEAACWQACLVGNRFGVVMPDRNTLPLYRERILNYGLRERLAGLRAIEATVQTHHAAPAGSEAALRAAIMDLVVNEGSEAVVLAGASMTGLQRRLQPLVPVPLLDGIASGVILLEGLIRLNLPHSHVNGDGKPYTTTLSGLSGPCTELLSGLPSARKSI
ncbi:aspartate/glutamate racemase family protein [Halomonas alkaliantarctica]|uniref:Aspartate/glutamate racemase family protein n=1 Tax=Halomonas alkaliantarctica TaxID=232346 RepID=A0ABY8LL86_9GAMM|nr:aspartate/glutamate racemase family protein [Halomonas alkaliantarctica]WGI25200.1 aspartate/glutamate racemase family protein [Halomonas alkaliantarctica]